MKPTKYCRGFTLVELVVVIVVVGILSVSILPRFTDKATFNQVGFKDQVLAALQHARKTAVASRRYVCVTTSAVGLSLQLDTRLPDGLTAPACSGNPSPINLNLPAQSSNSISTPSDASLSPATSVRFDPLGRASQTVTFIISGQTVTVEQETGYVH